MPTEQELEQLYNSLPQNTKDLMSSPNTARELQNIARQYNLDVPNTEMLINEVGLVLLGLEDPETFVDDLVEVLEMEKEQATNLAGELSKSIFSQVEIVPATLPEEILKDTDTIGEHVEESDVKNIREILRENSKTASIKNLVANLK